MKTILGKTYFVSDYRCKLHECPIFLIKNNSRLLLSFEVQRMWKESFPWLQLGIVGEFWTSAKVSCHKNLAWRITGLGEAGPVPGGWEKTLDAWIVGVSRE